VPGWLCGGPDCRRRQGRSAPPPAAPVLRREGPMRSRTMRITVVATVVASACTPAQGNPPESTLDHATVNTLHDQMRRLWADHVGYTRSYVVSAVGGLPDTTAIADRLMKNQEDIGDAVAEYYGRPAGDTVTTLLKSHITGA